MMYVPQRTLKQYAKYRIKLLYQLGFLRRKGEDRKDPREDALLDALLARGSENSIDTALHGVYTAAYTINDLLKGTE